MTTDPNLHPFARHPSYDTAGHPGGQKQNTSWFLAPSHLGSRQSSVCIRVKRRWMRRRSYAATESCLLGGFGDVG